MTAAAPAGVNTWLTRAPVQAGLTLAPRGTISAGPSDLGIHVTDSATDSNQPRITLYTSAICPYCVAAKNFLKSKGQTWSEVRIDTDPAAREKMMALARRTSVPQIFVGDTHVGGYDDMMALHREGKLEPLLAGHGAADPA